METPSRLNTAPRLIPSMAMTRQPSRCPSHRHIRSETHPPQAIPTAFAIVMTNAFCRLSGAGRFNTLLK